VREVLQCVLSCLTIHVTGQVEPYIVPTLPQAGDGTDRGLVVLRAGQPRDHQQSCGCAFTHTTPAGVCPGGDRFDGAAVRDDVDAMRGE
jgi:hypothetical protein